MGALLQSILQGGGRIGSELQEAKTANLQDKQQADKFKLDLQELQARLKGQGIENKLKTARKWLGSRTGPDGKTYEAFEDPLTGNLTYELSSGPTEESPVQKQIRELEAVVGPLSPEEKKIKGGLLPKPSSAQESIKSVNGVPVGIERGGKILTPNSPGWTPQDDVTWKSALASYKQGESDKTIRGEKLATSRAFAYGNTRMYGALDSQTGGLAYVNPDEIKKNPGRYSPAGPGMKALNANAIFLEIEYSKGMLNDAISALPDKAFDAVTSANVAMVLRDADPKSAWQNFINSEASKVLESDPQMVEYVTTLVSMQESAMSLRTLGGQGQGSDMLRTAILRMLPGTGTPSKSYAQRQMRLLSGQIDQLHKGIPKMTVPDSSGGATMQPGDKKTLKNGKTVTITKVYPDGSFDAN